MLLDAEMGAGQRIERRFTLYVDDRLVLLGTDDRGRDLLFRLLATMKFTIVPGSIAVVISVVFGTLIGAYGGFYGGWARALLAGASTVIQSVPGLLLIFLAAVISVFNIYLVMVVVGVILIPETANGVLERVEALRKRDFVEAARELGMRDRTILWKEIVWHNARGFLVTRITQGFVFAILIDVTLSYMGLANLNSTRLGTMLLEGRTAVLGGQSTALALAPLSALLVAIVSFSLLERGVLGFWERRR